MNPNDLIYFPLLNETLKDNKPKKKTMKDIFEFKKKSTK